MPLIPLPAFSDNYIWMLVDDAGRVLIVDPGEAAPVVAAIDDSMQPFAVLITHHHNDHLGGLHELLHRWPQLQVFAPEDPRIDAPCTRVRDGESIVVGNWRFEVKAVPGHTLTHIVYYGHVDGRPTLFCGDTLFSLGCGRLFEGTPMQMLTSLDAIATLPDDTRVCCGHEYTLSNARFAALVDADNTALRECIDNARTLRDAGLPSLPARLGDERAANPFLRVDDPAIQRAVAAHLGRSPSDRIETFAELRRWKDGFRG